MAQSRYAEGFIRCVEGRHQEGYEAMDRATSDPNFAAAHAQKANQLVRLGRAREALPVARHAVELAGPYDQSTGVVYWVLGRAYFVLKDYDDAIHWLQRSVDKRGNLWFSGAFLVAAYALPGAIKRPAKRCVNSTVGIRLVHAAADCQDLRHRTSQQPSTAPRRIVPWPKTRRCRTLS
jgi:tetratricopeptide (TPR) repeat protein